MFFFTLGSYHASVVIWWNKIGVKRRDWRLSSAFDWAGTQYLGSAAQSLRSRLWLETTTPVKDGSIELKIFWLHFYSGGEEAATIFIRVYVLEQLCCEECRKSP